MHQTLPWDVEVDICNFKRKFLLVIFFVPPVLHNLLLLEIFFKYAKLFSSFSYISEYRPGTLLTFLSLQANTTLNGEAFFLFLLDRMALIPVFFPSRMKNFNFICFWFGLYCLEDLWIFLLWEEWYPNYFNLNSMDSCN